MTPLSLTHPSCPVKPIYSKLVSFILPTSKRMKLNFGVKYPHRHHVGIPTPDTSNSIMFSPVRRFSKNAPIASENGQMSVTWQLPRQAVSILWTLSSQWAKKVPESKVLITRRLYSTTRVMISTSMLFTILSVVIFVFVRLGKIIRGSRTWRESLIEGNGIEHGIKWWSATRGGLCNGEKDMVFSTGSKWSYAPACLHTYLGYLNLK